MKIQTERRHAAEDAAGDCLRRSVARLTGEAVERRQESLMELAETELGLGRAYAEQVYALAEEEQLEPIYAFQLIRCGIGVRELTPPEQDLEEFSASQEAPPDWVGEAVVELDDAALERTLRATFRRLRSHLESAASTEMAVEAFLAEPDVGAVQLRGEEARGGS